MAGGARADSASDSFGALWGGSLCYGDEAPADHRPRQDAGGAPGRPVPEELPMRPMPSFLDALAAAEAHVAVRPCRASPRPEQRRMAGLAAELLATPPDAAGVGPLHWRQRRFVSDLELTTQDVLEHEASPDVGRWRTGAASGADTPCVTPQAQAGSQGSAKLAEGSPAQRRPESPGAPESSGGGAREHPVSESFGTPRLRSQGESLAQGLDAPCGPCGLGGARGTSWELSSVGEPRASDPAPGTDSPCEAPSHSARAESCEEDILTLQYCAEGSACARYAALAGRAAQGASVHGETGELTLAYEPHDSEATLAYRLGPMPEAMTLPYEAALGSQPPCAVGAHSEAVHRSSSGQSDDLTQPWYEAPSLAACGPPSAAAPEARGPQRSAARDAALTPQKVSGAPRSAAPTALGPKPSQRGAPAVATSARPRRSATAAIAAARAAMEESLREPQWLEPAAKRRRTEAGAPQKQSSPRADSVAGAGGWPLSVAPTRSKKQLTLAEAFKGGRSSRRR